MMIRCTYNPYPAYTPRMCL
uniref:Uncharacterized protein n=1 Tax=Arundo donax TaxID=35708 RepID=A0A0A8YWK0_ARUDO